MSLNEQERKSIEARFEAEFGYSLEDVFPNGAIIEDDSFLSLMREVLDNNDKCKPVNALFSGAGLNKKLRRYGLVEYRCHRGCLLGALVNYRGEYFMFTEQVVDTDEGYIDWVALDRELDDINQTAPGNGGSGNSTGMPSFKEVLAVVKRFSGTVEGHPITSLRGVLSLPKLAPSVSPGRRVHLLGEDEFYRMNCRHSELSLAGSSVFEDARKMARKSKRVIRVAPQG